MKKDKAFEKQQKKIAEERSEVAKSSKGKTYMGRPTHELDKEQGTTRPSKKQSTSDGYMVKKVGKLYDVKTGKHVGESAVLKEAREHGNYRREVDRRQEKEDKK